MMNDFNKWFAQQTAGDGNNKLFRNRRGMELAWNESREQLKKEHVNNHVPPLQEYVDAFNPTGESDDA